MVSTTINKAIKDIRELFRNKLYKKEALYNFLKEKK